MTIVHMPLKGDLSLLEGEDPDILAEAADVAGEGWLDQANIHLAGHAPRSLIEQGYLIPVRDLLRQIKSGCFA